MEFNPSSTEKPDQRVWSSSEDRDQVRSYTCTFCKRGFSNAQALGGHMNIHRKDRAKLREFSGDQISLNIPHEESSQILESSSEEKSCTTPKRPWLFRKEDGDHHVSRGKDGVVGEVKQLNLFVETSSSSSKVEIQKSKESSHGSSHEELDLELRLGLEHHETSTTGAHGD